METSLPFKPKWSKQWIETKLKRRFFKKPYDRFMWWRSYTPKKKRLLEDHEKDEFKKLDDLRRLFKKEFRMTEDEYQKEITKGSDTLVDFYYKLDDKYGKRNIRK